MNVAVDIMPKLKLSAAPDDIRHNESVLDAARQELMVHVKVLESLTAANRVMCQHKDKESYCDARDGGGWDCPDCGESR